MRQVFVAIALLLVLFAAPVRAETQLERGRYLVETLAGCGNCHTPRGPNGPLKDKKFAGGEIIKHEDFTAVVANITPDLETGIGGWTGAANRTSSSAMATNTCRIGFILRMCR